MEIEILLGALCGVVGAAVVAFMSRGKLRATEATTTVRARAITKTETTAVARAGTVLREADAYLAEINELPADVRLDEIADLAGDMFK